MNQRKKVPMSLDIRSGYGWELLATFKTRAEKAGWDNPDIGSVLLEALSGNYNHLVETLEPITPNTQSDINVEAFDSLFIKRANQHFKESHLRLIYYFLKRMELFISQDTKKIEQEWLTLFSLTDITEIIQHMTTGFARIEFEDLNDCNKEQLLSFLPHHTSFLAFIIHVVEDHLSSTMHPVCTQTDVDYLLSYEGASEDDLCTLPFSQWTDQQWNRYRKFTLDSDLILKFILLEKEDSEEKKYDTIESMEIYENYEQAWFAFKRRLDKNPLTCIRLSNAWIDPNN